MDAGRELATELWLIRHGESMGNLEGRYQGHADLPLSPRGHEQASRLAQRLARIAARRPFAALYSSDLQRAQQTARPVSQALGLPVQVDPGLREIDVGVWAGLTFQEIAQRFPRQWAASTDVVDPHLERGGGESYAQAQARIVAQVNAIAQRHPGQRVLIVFHGGVLRAYLLHLLGLDLSNLRRLRTDNTAINRVLAYPAPRGDGPGRALPGVVISVNDVAHLETAPEEGPIGETPARPLAEQETPE